MNLRTIETYRSVHIEAALEHEHRGYVAWIRYLDRHRIVAHRQVTPPVGKCFAAVDVLVKQLRAEIDEMIRRGDATEDQRRVHWAPRPSLRMP
ncbi:hypothetical protein [Pandoraea terrigena]|uniref:Uncharacterized protein n=1 Tax=Pandoraea terrigena TaxID=2508292 RepID=A0A5E4USR1_9BURK|nr:hypothetical protein [Pandoraea terrigena]VVE02534.1 hypothetical protein PTE31013_02218 [Pandoraea terrigena]